MRRYETIFIVDPDLAEDARKQRFEKVTSLIDGENGVMIEFDDWGSKKLAYEIRRKTRGYYVRLDYCGEGKLVNELERTFRLDEKFLKYMTIILDENADPEKIKAELTSAKEAAEAAETEAAAPAPAAAAVDAPEVEKTEAADAPEAEKTEAADAPEAEKTEAADAPEADTDATESNEEDN